MKLLIEVLEVEGNCENCDFFTVDDCSDVKCVVGKYYKITSIERVDNEAM
jgi:hypothetical protein